MKHTILPWETSVNSDNEFDICMADAGDMIADLKDTSNQEANAEFIVKACNCHEELVEACNYALEQIQRTFDITDQIHMPPGWLDADIGLNNARGSLQETLAKATK